MMKMKKAIFALCIGLAAIALVGCKSEEDGGEQLLIVTDEVGEDDVIEQTGVEVTLPKDAYYKKYYVATPKDGGQTIAEYDFTLGKLPVMVRARKVDEKSVYDYDDESGYNLFLAEAEWDTEEKCMVVSYDGMIYMSGDAGYVVWINPDKGVLYDVCVAQDVDEDSLIDLAEQVAEVN